MKKKNYIWVVEYGNGISKYMAAFSIRKTARIDQKITRKNGVKNARIRKYIAI
jgi:hypothetical protein